MIALTLSFKFDDKKSLFILANGNKYVYLSARNLPKVQVVTASELNTYIVLNSNALVLTEESVAAIEQIFKV
jgi:large subunit ribosomal protein L4